MLQFQVVYTWLPSIPTGQVTEQKQHNHLICYLEIVFRERSEKENSMELHLALYAHEQTQLKPLSLLLTLTNFNSVLSFQTNLSEIPVYCTSA